MMDMVDRLSCIERLRTLLAAASPTPWEPGWNSRYFDNGYVSMCGRGPDTIALRQSDERFSELVGNVALADAQLIAEAINALPWLLDTAALNEQPRPVDETKE